MGGGSGTVDPTLAVEHDPTDHFPFRHLERCRKPVFAAINGICHAGGLNLVLYSDFSIAIRPGHVPGARAAARRAGSLHRGAPRATTSASATRDGCCSRRRWSTPTRRARWVSSAGSCPTTSSTAAVDETIAQLKRLAPKTTSSIKDDINRPLRQPDVRIFQRSIMSPEMRRGHAGVRREARRRLAARLIRPRSLRPSSAA